METKYIIKDNNIYEVISENKAAKVNVENGVAKINKKETVDFDKDNDFAYAFFEIRAKFAPLFQVEEEEIENAEDYEKIIAEKDSIIASLQAKVQELEELVERLTKELEDIKSTEPEQESEKGLESTEPETPKDGE